MLLDKDIREPLFDYLEEFFGKIRVFEEKIMGRSRADAFAVTQEGLVGIEIKSDADSYARLKSQIRDYDAFFDRNIVVVGTSHATHIEEHVPSHWGIITVEETAGEGGAETAYGSADFYMLRKPKDNPQRDLKKQLGFLWRPELVRIQARYEMPRYKEKSKAFVVDKILAALPEEEVRAEICRELFERDYTTIGDEITAFKKEAAAKRYGKGKKRRPRAKSVRVNVRRARKKA